MAEREQSEQGVKGREKEALTGVRSGLRNDEEEEEGDASMMEVKSSCILTSSAAR